MEECFIEIIVSFLLITVGLPAVSFILVYGCDYMNKAEYQVFLYFNEKYTGDMIELQNKFRDKGAEMKCANMFSIAYVGVVSVNQVTDKSLRLTAIGGSRLTFNGFANLRFMMQLAKKVIGDDIVHMDGYVSHGFGCNKLRMESF